MTEAQAAYLTDLCNMILAIEITRVCKITKYSNPPAALHGLQVVARERLGHIASGEYMVRGASNAIETAKSDLARARLIAR